MTKRDTLSEALNLRVDSGLAAEIERIASARGTTASEVARELLGHGVQVERLVEAQQLSRHFTAPPFDRKKGRVVIEARFEWLTNRELQDLEFGPDLDEFGDPV